MSQNYQIAVFSDRFLARKEFRPGDLVIVVNMNNRQLKRHDTLPHLTETQTDLGSPDSRHDGLTANADPRIFMLSEAIKQTLDSSFTGLQSTFTAISTQMERIASRPSPFHAHEAGGRISLRTPTSARTRVSPRRHRAATSADGSPSPSSQSGGGGEGVFQIAGETNPRKMRTVMMPLVCFLRKKYLCLLWHRRRVNSESTRIL